MADAHVELPPEPVRDLEASEGRHAKEGEADGWLSRDTQPLPPPGYESWADVPPDDVELPAGDDLGYPRCVRYMHKT